MEQDNNFKGINNPGPSAHIVLNNHYKFANAILEHNKEHKKYKIKQTFLSILIFVIFLVVGVLLYFNFAHTNVTIIPHIKTYVGYSALILDVFFIIILGYLIYDCYFSRQGNWFANKLQYEEDVYNNKIVLKNNQFNNEFITRFY